MNHNRTRQPLERPLVPRNSLLLGDLKKTLLALDLGILFRQVGCGMIFRRHPDHVACLAHSVVIRVGLQVVSECRLVSTIKFGTQKNQRGRNKNKNKRRTRTRKMRVRRTSGVYLVR